MTFVDAPELVAGKTHKQYYPLRDYPRAGAIGNDPQLPAIDDYAARGREQPTDYAPNLQDQLFSIAVSAIEDKP